MFKSLHTYLPGSLDQFLFRRFRSSDRASHSPSPPRPSARRPQLLIPRINTIPTEILLEIFLLVVSSSLSESCSECHRHRHSGSQILLTHPPSMILSHMCKRWREIMLECPLVWSFISNRDFCCEEWMKILLSRLWRVSPQSGPLFHPGKDNNYGNDTPLLTIRFRICSRQTQTQIGRQIRLLQFLIHRSPSRIRDLSADIADDEVFEQVFHGWGMLAEDYGWGRPKEPTKWTQNLEELNISKGDPCGDVDEIESNYAYENWAVDIEKEEKEEQYISYLTFRHTPPLLFWPNGFSEPVYILEDRYNDKDDDETTKPEPELRSRLSHLRKLSLRNCYLPLRQHLHFRNVEELTVIHAEPIWGLCPSLYWKSVFHSLPRLRRLSIQQALTWCDLGVPPSWREGHPNFEKPSTNLEELNVNRCPPLGAAVMLHFFTNSPGVVDDQRQRKQCPRKLQITCTNVGYDEGFRELCEAIRAWFNSWSSWTYGGGGGYLYLSIGPSGLVVHNRRVNITESGEVNREAKSATDEEEPEIQLTLYSHNILKLDLISDVLHLISSSPNEFDATARPFTLSCEELELSVGLFDVEDDRIAGVLTSFLEAFGKAKTLRKLRCVGSTTARVLLSRESRGLTLLPMLQSVYFDHVDFSDLDQVTRMMPSRVELIKCRNVRREWVSKLQHAGTDVLLGRGTSIVEWSEGSTKKVERWTSEQVKVTFYKLRRPLRTLRTNDNLDANEQVGQ